MYCVVLCCVGVWGFLLGFFAVVVVVWFWVAGLLLVGCGMFFRAVVTGVTYGLVTYGCWILVAWLSILSIARIDKQESRLP